MNGLKSFHSDMERIGQEAGEMFERYIEAIFRFAGFVTERDRLFPTGTVKHEIDIYAESNFANVSIECKDWQYIDIGTLKKELDAFITKTRDIGASTGVFAISGTTDRFERYKGYLKDHGLTFWDKNDIEKWHEAIIRNKERSQYQKALCDSLGIEARPPTNSEKVFGFLRKAGSLTAKAGRMTVKAAIATDKILTDSGKPNRRRKVKRKSY